MTNPEAPTGVHASAFGCITLPFLLVTLVILLWGARANWRNGDLDARGYVVEGQVIELRHVPSNPTIRSGRRSTASPVVRFTTRSGEAREAIGSVNRGPAPWKVGDMVAIVYDPRHPERADLQSEIDTWRFWFTLWCVVALLPLTIAMAPVMMIVRERRARRR
ncbi:DUF3592 domain-containing protein [Luteitalea sp.]